MAAKLRHQGKGGWLVMIPTLLFFSHTPMPGLHLFSQNLHTCLPVCESGHPRLRVGGRGLDLHPPNTQ